MLRFLKVLASQPLVSIVIVNFNGRRFVEPSLKSVLNTEYPNFEVIFVDNGSTDGSVEFVRKSFGTDSRIKIIQNTENLGPAKGLDIGIMEAKGEYLVFLDNDIDVDPRWLNHLVRVMEGDRTIGATQCKLLLHSDPRRIDTAGCMLDVHGCPIERGAIGFGGLRYCETDRGQYDEDKEIFSASCAAMVRRGVLDEVGWHDPELFACYEDVDLAWRVRLGGYRVVLVPEAVGYHRRSATWVKKRRLNIFVWQHYCKNAIAVLIKNYDLKNLVKIMPLTLSLQLMSFIWRGIIEGNGRMALVPFRAILWNVRNFRYLWSQRMFVQKEVRRVSDDEIMKIMPKKCFLIRYYLGPYLGGHLSKGATEPS